jgi:hypothetical protein
MQQSARLRLRAPRSLRALRSSYGASGNANGGGDPIADRACNAGLASNVQESALTSLRHEGNIVARSHPNAMFWSIEHWATSTVPASPTLQSFERVQRVGTADNP